MSALLAIGLPLALALGLIFRPLRRVAVLLAPLAPLPALGLALFAREGTGVELPVLLLGVELRLADPVARGFLLFTAVVWLMAGWFAAASTRDDPARARLWGFFLLTQAGNLGLLLAGNLATFYLFYSAMTFAAWGLVLHRGDRAARRAGRVYLTMAVGAEGLLLAGFMFLSGSQFNRSLAELPAMVAGSPHRDLVIGLVVAGFGVKAGLVPLHLWLPLAHPVAPTPASAVLSGALIKAGLFGLIRLLPLGLIALPAWGGLLIGLGLLGALLAAAVGVTQTDPKTVLAYSSVSQIGLAIFLLGVGLAVPGAWAEASAALVFFALHHGLSKAALFLGVEVIGRAGAGWRAGLVLTGLGWSALQVAGAPLTSGALSKSSLHHLALLPVPGSELLGWGISIGAVGSTLLMLRFLSLGPAHRWPGTLRASRWAPWALLVLTQAGLLIWSPVSRPPLALLAEPHQLWAAAWPVGLGLAIAVLARWRAPPRVPPGDLLALAGPLQAGWRRARTAGWARAVAVGRAVRATWPAGAWRSLGRGLDGAEQRLSGYWLTGALLLALPALVWLLSRGAG